MMMGSDMSMAGDELTDRAFLSVILWPEGLTRQEQAALVAGPSGLDEPTLRLRVSQNPPAILGLIDARRARAAVEIIRARGGDAFAPAMSDLEALGPTLKIKRLERNGAEFAAAMWRDPPPPLRFRAADLIAVIRGRLSQTPPHQISLQAAETYVPISESEFLRRPVSVDLYGAIGLAVRLHAGWFDDPPVTIGKGGDARLSHKIDLHTRDGRVLQIDADKFGFEVLGASRGHSDLVNTDRLCEMIALLAPEAVIDPYYSLFKPPPEHRRMRLPMMRLNDDDPAFAFYSRWAALMYRHMLGVR
jgi:hypothetical protein